MTKRKTKAPPPGPSKRPGVRLNRPDDVRRLLSRLINQTMADEVTTDKLRAISYACQTVLKVFELSMIEQRFAEIERGIDEIRQQTKKT
jgi:hypothetical protein